MAKRIKRASRRNTKKTVRKTTARKAKRAPYRKGKGDKKFVYALKKVGNKKRLTYVGKLQ